MKKSFAALALIAAVAAAGAYFFRHGETGAVAQEMRPAAADVLLQSSFTDLAGKAQPLAQWRGKVMVVNFWATWCPPCRSEIPEFVKLQEKYREKGLIFVGIALDQKDKVQAFADEAGINYPVLLGELDAVELSRQAGNRLGGLPFTAIVDRRGKLAATEVGELAPARLESLVGPLL